MLFPYSYTIDKPKTTTSFIDRFLVSANAYNVKVVLLFNKMDIYLNRVTIQHPDSISKSADVIVKLSRQNKEIFKYALRMANAKPENSVIIGDDLEVDIKGARQINIQGIYFNPKKKEHQEENLIEISCLSQIMKIL